MSATSFIQDVMQCLDRIDWHIDKANDLLDRLSDILERANSTPTNRE